jgi:hypothetical protein
VRVFWLVFFFFFFFLCKVNKNDCHHFLRKEHFDTNNINRAQYWNKEYFFQSEDNWQHFAPTFEYRKLQHKI